jgi:DNA polymerase III subunit gamma/tau
MPYEPLHHKYRPQTLADLVGQEAIVQTLSNALTTRRIAPAYLFTGPRGTGKTSSARIFAKSLNCLRSSEPTPTPCGECEVCKSIARGSALDVIEIDAASNTGVDNIREIIDRAQFAPVQCRYKVYAIDECHMLSTAAFNALLKTLEEPPDRVVFILATTDPQRVLPTIISRCQRFDYRRIPLEAMASHLSYIARQESIDITEEAIAIIAQLANGGLRDAESLLDQLSLFLGTIVPKKVWDLIGAVPEDDLLVLMRAIRSDNSEAVIQQCRQILDRGKEPLVVLQNLANFYLNLLIAKTSPNRADLVAVTSATWQELILEAKQWQTGLVLQGQKQLKDSEFQLKNTTQPRLWLEITLLSLLPSANQVALVNHNNYNKSSESSAIAPQQGRSISSNNNNNNTVNLPPHNISIPEDKTIREEPINIKSTQTVNIPDSPEENRNNSAPNIPPEAIWKKAIDVVEPPTTKELLRQQCFLISFDETIAKIGIGSPQLMKLHQGKLANIEAAFSQICQYKVKAVFEVANLPRDREKKTSGRNNILSTKTNENQAASEPIENKININNISDKSPSNFVVQPSDNNNLNAISSTTKVVDIQSYRREHREQEQVTPQIREANGSDFLTKQLIEPEKGTLNLPTETTTFETETSNLDTFDHEDSNNYSTEEVGRIAANFAIFFSGEVIKNEDK